MIKIGITGSIASGKTTASKILSHRRGPLFNADEVVKKLYKTSSFRRILFKKFKLKKKSNLKKILKNKIFNDRLNLLKLEKIIHPVVRKEMKKFSITHRKKEMIFYDIPLLVESKLMNYFDLIFFIKAKKKTRKKRFKNRGGDEKLFNILNNKQFSDRIKTKLCDYVVVNEKNLNILKTNLSDIMKNHV